MISVNFLFYFILFYFKNPKHLTNHLRYCVYLTQDKKEHLSSTDVMAETMTKLNRTNQEQLIAKKIYIHYDSGKQ